MKSLENLNVNKMSREKLKSLCYIVLTVTLKKKLSDAN